MTEDQRLLTKYLVDLNTPLTYILSIVGSLWRDDLVMEMFQYIAEHPDAEYPELYSVACKIASREGTLKDSDDFCDIDE